MKFTGKSRASQWAEVSNYKKCTAIGSQQRFAYRRCCEISQLCHSVLWVRSQFASSLFNCDHCFSALLRSSQLCSIFATHFNSSQSCSISPLLSSTLFTSSLLFSTLPNYSRLCPPRLHSSQLFWTHLNSSSTLPTSSHLCATHLTSFSAHVNSSHLLNSG